MRMKINSIMIGAALIVSVSSCDNADAVDANAQAEPCHSIDHPDIDLTLKSMDDYASMNWEEHRASYTEDGTMKCTFTDSQSGNVKSVDLRIGQGNSAQSAIEDNLDLDEFEIE